MFHASRVLFPMNKTVSECNDRVGIVMLLYNRADVAVPCIRSLVQAKTYVAWEIYLLDNASLLSESEKVKAEFDRLVQAGYLSGQFVRSEVNHGFPRGNNVGIRQCMVRSDITHICLLNSDVVVTDYWLDRLLEKKVDAIGPVTNACGNEQTIPVPFSFKSTDKADEADNIYVAVNQWAQERHTAFQGYCKETDFLGFFCFLARMELFLTVCLLDERFGRGAYEDDDFCIRILAKGFRMVVARDVFIYHWGTASFSQIPFQTLTRILKKNLKKFEDKYACRWKDRSLLPIRSVFDDLEFVAKKTGDWNFEMAKLFAIRSMDYVRHVIDEKARKQPGSRLFSHFRSSLDRMSRWWSARRASKMIEFLKHLVMRQPVLVLGRFYPADTDLKDGYFQRVLLIDSNLEDHCRIYIRYEGADSLAGILPKLSKKKRLVYEFIVRKKNILHAAFAAMIALVCGRIYVHSVLRFDDRITRLLYRVSRKRVFDIHGVVPEEFWYEGDEDNSRKFDNLERWAVERASLLVVVTRSMADHLTAKYGVDLERRFACLSMLPQTGRWNIEASDTKSGEGIIYCGGLHKWQQIDKMLEYVHRNAGRYRFTFLVTDPDEIKRRYKNRYIAEFPGIVSSASPHEVSSWYEANSYGLVFRKDVVVNRVACPTKLVEYLQHGLVPIVDSPDIGDFGRYGYRYVHIDSPLPDNNMRIQMALENRAVLQKLFYQFICGRDQLDILN